MSRLPTTLDDILTTLASHAAIDAAIALQDSYANPYLASNPNLTNDQRERLAKGADINLKSRLANSALGDEQIRIALRDTRHQVRSNLFYSGFKGASPELLQEIASPNLSRQDAHDWLHSSYPIPKTLLKKLITTAFSTNVIPHLKDTEIFTTAELIKQLSRINNAKITSTPLARLLDHRPDAIAPLLELVIPLSRVPKSSKSSKVGLTPDAILTALASSRHIFDQQIFLDVITYSHRLSYLQRRGVLHLLLNNPNLAPDTVSVIVKEFKESKAAAAPKDYDLARKALTARTRLQLTTDWLQLTAKEDITTMVKATEELHKSFFRFPYPTLQPKYFPTAAPTRDDLSGVTLGSLYLVTQSSEPTARILGPQEFDSLVLPLIEPLGRQGWDIFFALSTSWDASVADLVDATSSAIS